MNMANAQFEEFKKVNKSTIVLSPLPPASKTLEKLDKYESKVTEVLINIKKLSLILFFCFSLSLLWQNHLFQPPLYAD